MKGPLLCPQCKNDVHYYLSASNETGWKCCACPFKPGEPPGFSPEHDRQNILFKVMAVLMTLTEADVVSVSNGTHGEGIELAVAKRCQRTKRFDQYSIALFILEGMTPSHAKFWREISEGILAGKDPRKRCHCGKLATSFTWDNEGKSVSQCSEHWSFT